MDEMRVTVEARERALKRRRQETADAKQAADLAKEEARKAAAEAVAAKQRAAAEKQAAKRLERERLDRFSRLKALLRRSCIYCTCKLTIHADKCRLWSASHQLRRWGYDVGVPLEDVEWYLQQPGANR